jgi:hypothetical protein
MLKLNFSSDFCGSVMEDIFNDNIKVIIDKKDATIIIKDYVSELETIISPGENEFFFFLRSMVFCIGLEYIKEENI